MNSPLLCVKEKTPPVWQWSTSVVPVWFSTPVCCSDWHCWSTSVVPVWFSTPVCCSDWHCWSTSVVPIWFSTPVCCSDWHLKYQCCTSMVFHTCMLLWLTLQGLVLYQYGLHSSGAMWESRWPSWTVCPNEPSGFRGRKDLLNHALALVSACP